MVRPVLDVYDPGNLLLDYADDDTLSPQRNSDQSVHGGEALQVCASSPVER